MPRDSTKPKSLRWERRPAERPGELLDAALRVFAARGYRNASLEEVAAAAGVTKGAVYHHFTNKEQLLSQGARASSASARSRGSRAHSGMSMDRRRRGCAFSFGSAFGGDDPVRARRAAACCTRSRTRRRTSTAGGSRPARCDGGASSSRSSSKASESGEFRAAMRTPRSTARVALVGVLAQFVVAAVCRVRPGSRSTANG